MSCKVGNQTNSQDPQAVNSRVFVGNLNTFQCSKTDVERMFQRYGRIAGISMHKGYAFIQFTNPFDARSACLGEDGRLLWGQTLDVNMVAEPKAHQTGRKRQNIAKTGNDWDYYYDSYYAQVGFPTPRLVPPMKRARLHVPPQQPTITSRSNVTKGAPTNKSQPPNNASLNELKSYSTPDILICGNCRELFSAVDQLLEHKKAYCKLRFTCKCHILNGCKAKTPGEEPASLLCSQCKDSFHSAWDLMVHVQAAHMLNIYQLGVEATVMNTIATSSITDTSEEVKLENGSPFELSSPSTSTNGPILSDSLMEDSHCQTDDLFTSTVTTPEASCTSTLNNNNGDMALLPHSSIITSNESCCLPTARNSSMMMLMGEGLDAPNNHLILQNPQFQVHGNGPVPAPVSTNTSTSGSFPMEASTQTVQADASAPNNFEDHLGLLASMKKEAMVSFTNGQAAGV